MKVLVTGAGGFVGSYLIDELLKHGHHVTGIGISIGQKKPKSKKLRFIKCDLSKSREVADIVKKLSFDAVVHLAGTAQSNLSGPQESLYFKSNVLATLNLCSAIEKKKNKPVFLFVSSAMIFAGLLKTPRIFNETDAAAPTNAYASSKLAAEFVVKSFSAAFRRTIIARPSNHTGPGQSRDYVAPALAARVSAVKSGGPLKVGNLSSVRDISDVRDIARAYRLMIENKKAEGIFVLGSGQRTKIQEVLDRLLAIAGKTVQIQQQKSLLRKLDPSEVIADISRAQRVLGWSPELALNRTLFDIFQFERALAHEQR